MTSFLRSMLVRSLRNTAALACAAAVSMQIVVPVLHGTHAETLASHGSAIEISGVVLSSPNDFHGETAHDRADCPQCRIVSQLKTLTPSASFSSAPLLSAHWFADTQIDRSHALEALEGAPPRGPPVLA